MIILKTRICSSKVFLQTTPQSTRAQRTCSHARGCRARASLCTVIDTETTMAFIGRAARSTRTLTAAPHTCVSFGALLPASDRRDHSESLACRLRIRGVSPDHAAVRASAAHVLTRRTVSLPAESLQLSDAATTMAFHLMTAPSTRTLIAVPRPSRTSNEHTRDFLRPAPASIRRDHLGSLAYQPAGSSFRSRLRFLARPAASPLERSAPAHTLDGVALERVSALRPTRDDDRVLLMRFTRLLAHALASQSRDSSFAFVCAQSCRSRAKCTSSACGRR